MNFMRTSDDLQEDAGQAAIADGAAGAERQIDGAMGPGGRTAIVYDHGDGTIVAPIGDQHARAERQRAMRCRKSRRVVRNAGGRAPLVMLAAVAARDLAARRPCECAKDQRGEKRSHRSPALFEEANGRAARRGGTAAALRTCAVGDRPHAAGDG
jgi:hypothetical protein